MQKVLRFRCKNSRGILKVSYHCFSFVNFSINWGPKISLANSAPFSGKCLRKHSLQRKKKLTRGTNFFGFNIRSQERLHCKKVSIRGTYKKIPTLQKLSRLWQWCRCSPLLFLSLSHCFWPSLGLNRRYNR